MPVWLVFRRWGRAARCCSTSTSGWDASCRTAGSSSARSKPSTNTWTWSCVIATSSGKSSRFRTESGSPPDDHQLTQICVYVAMSGPPPVIPPPLHCWHAPPPQPILYPPLLTQSSSFTTQNQALNLWLQSPLSSCSLQNTSDCMDLMNFNTLVLFLAAFFNFSFSLVFVYNCNFNFF